MGQRHSVAFREQCLRKLYERGDRTISQVADELGLQTRTLKYWMKYSRKRSRAAASPFRLGSRIRLSW